MIRFYIPKDLSEVKPYLSQTEIKQSLIMVAEENEGIQAICCFYYKDGVVSVNRILSCEEPPRLVILDGLLRSVLFHAAELDCTAVKISCYPEVMEDYFRRLGLVQKEDCYFCDHFPSVFFSGCTACQRQPG